MGRKIVERADYSTYLESLTSFVELVSDEILARVQNAYLVFTNLRHIWRRYDVRFSTKGQACCPAACSVLIYGCKAWSLRVSDIRSLLVFNH